MGVNFLEFEQPIAELEAKIEDLKMIGNKDEIDIQTEISILKEKSKALTKKIFSNLDEWQISQLSRHPLRPYFLDYVKNIFTDFIELHGDRAFADDQAIIGGLAKLNDQSVVIIGHQKGRSTKEKLKRNFGMPKPEGYRKALRLMKLAERFKLPLLTFIDTPGAYPGIDAEERGQSEAIARNLIEMAELKTPIISTVIGEGGSGGALAIGVCDVNIMLEFTTYSVISPEGCASILWKNVDYASDAAKAMGINARKLEKLGLINIVVPEPLGSAYRNPEATAQNLKSAIVSQLNILNELPTTTLLEKRYQRYMNFGEFKQTN